MKPHLPNPYNYSCFHKNSVVMTTTKSMNTPGLFDLRSLYLFSSYCILHFFSGWSPVLAFIVVKTILEYLGSLAAFSTILYNFFKSYGEVRRVVLDYKWKRKRRQDHLKEKKKEEPPRATLPLDNDLDVFD